MYLHLAIHNERQSRRPELAATPVFVEPNVLAYIVKHFKSPRHWRWLVTRKTFPFHWYFVNVDDSPCLYEGFLARHLIIEMSDIIPTSVKYCDVMLCELLNLYPRVCSYLNTMCLETDINLYDTWV